MLNLLRQVFIPGIIGQTPLSTLMVPPGFQFTGNVPDLGGFTQSQQAVLAYIIAQTPQGNFQSSAAATITLTALQNLYQKLTNGGAVTVTLDSAYNIVNLLPFPYLGQVLTFQIVTNASTTVATPTLSDTAVTLAGTTTVTTAGFRQYTAAITQLSTTAAAQLTAGTTFTSIAQVGSTNNFTVTLGTNAIVPVVGSAIYLNVTAGTAGTTLPSNWYPINKVTSATSFVIATPPGTVWTATAATFPALASIPQNATTVGGVAVSGWTPGLPGVYSPTLTVTGMMGMAAGAMVV